MQVRQLTSADATALAALSQESFGVPDDVVPPRPGIHHWGVFDGAPARLVAAAEDRCHDSWLGGRPVPTAAVGSVMVAAEQRGRGLARRLMTHLLTAARARGAVVSTLFRTAPALYRSLGYEQIAELIDGTLPIQALRGIRVPEGVRVRRAAPGDPDDRAGIAALYTDLAREQSGWLTRTGPTLPDPATGPQALTVALDADGRLQGVLSWHRADATLTVDDLLTRTAPAGSALLAVLGSFDAVVGEIRLRTTGLDPVHWLVPGDGWRVDRVRPYMLRPIDLAAAVAARGWPEDLRGTVTISVDDWVCPWNTGHHRLEWRDGVGRVAPGEPGGPRMAVRGLGLLLAGGLDAAVLRRAGLLAGGTAADDRVLTRAMAGPRPGIRDFF
ncbi:GNAT family N-acetyltransferase [Nakamurella leprariae]|uniref:GNAT family N-acetyltransferase n=1 Tax=Nakamurella leprariae TaxID=2803911 RepID=A0A938YBV2_9ACTN|nr:GNAT family N-acetyltransferase [Nakamurella leprariae]MBM9466783.1 GNAT family N-acetyltransferase [Nakamurella leprariae]